MAKYYVKYKDLQTQAASLQKAGKKMASFEGRVISTANAMSGTGMAGFKKELTTNSKNTKSVSKKISSSGDTLSSIIAAYKLIETQKYQNFIGFSISAIIGAIKSLFDLITSGNKPDNASKGATALSPAYCPPDENDKEIQSNGRNEQVGQKLDEQIEKYEGKGISAPNCKVFANKVLEAMDRKKLPTTNENKKYEYVESDIVNKVDQMVVRGQRIVTATEVQAIYEKSKAGDVVQMYRNIIYSNNRTKISEHTAIIVETNVIKDGKLGVYILDGGAGDPKTADKRFWSYEDLAKGLSNPPESETFGFTIYSYVE